jgi:serine/threonine protein kinase
LTYFQASELLQGKFRGFTFGKYKVLERLGRGRNSNVFLCEQVGLRRKVALKILPLVKAENPVALARFSREARAAAALHHPNIVQTYDNGQENDLHFLVIEYVDGSSLQEIVEKFGPMTISRAAAYMRQAAIGLQHLHQTGLLHRDIKPANLLLDRQGIVKILDLGLARFFQDHEDLLTQQYDPRTILGTADYVSPEQAFHGQEVDTRADLYSLGATFYFLLAGRPPFAGKAVAEKLLYHLMKEPIPLRTLRPEIPEKLAVLVEKMMAKDREQRYQNAAAIVADLTSWTEVPLALPPACEMPQLSPAAQNAGYIKPSPVLATTAVLQEAATSHPAHSPQTKALTTRPPEQEARCEEPLEEPLLVLHPKQPPHRSHRAPRQHQNADAINVPSSNDTSPALSADVHRRPNSEEIYPAKVKVWRRRRLRRLAGAFIVATMVGSALGAIFSRRSAPVQAGYGYVQPADDPDQGRENLPSSHSCDPHPSAP